MSIAATACGSSPHRSTRVDRAAIGLIEETEGPLDQSVMREELVRAPSTDRPSPSRRPAAVSAVHPGSMPTLSGVTVIDLDVTEACNLGCVYCFKNELKGPSITLETAQSALEWLLDASGTATVVRVNFMGGEPTLKWDVIREFVPWARRRGASRGKSVRFSMTSNLTLWTQEIRDFVDQYGFGVLMSIDGCPEVQDEQRPAKNGKKMSQIVERWARSLLETRPQSQARATVTPPYVDRLRKSMTYFRELGFMEVAFACADFEAWTPTAMRVLREQLEEIVDDVAAAYAAGERFNLSVWKYYINKLIQPSDEGEDVEVRPQPCGAGKGYLMVDHRGDVWPCHRFDGADDDIGGHGTFKMANIFEDGFNDRLQRAFLDYDHLSNHKPRCTTCPVNSVCGGYCPAANVSDTKSLYAPHEAFCDATAHEYETATMLYERSKREGWCEELMKDCAGVESDGSK